MQAWQQLYRQKLKTAPEAMELLRSGSRVLVGSACGEPRHLIKNLFEASDRLSDLEVVQVLGMLPSCLSTAAAGLGEDATYRVKQFFVAAGGREAVTQGFTELIPLYLSEVPRLIAEGPLGIDAALIQVSPPDEHGNLSLGVAVEVAAEAVEQARVVIAQVNPLMPRTMGAGFVHLSQVDALVEFEHPLTVYQRPAPGETALQAARHVAKLIPNGATVHFGMGEIPQAALPLLKDHRNLGVHADALTDAYLEPIRTGAITGAGKTLHYRRIVASYCLGGPELFRFVDNNPQVELMPVRYTNDPHVIAQNDRMFTVHEAVEVDLTGQVCADVVAGRVFAGLGGMVDFLRGAAMSPGGHSILALTSTGPDGESRIRPAFSAGAGVMVTRSGVRTVVTEYGAAYLHGLSVGERAVALIDIAHPNHRDALLSQARDLGLIRPAAIMAPLFTGVYPEKYEKTLELKGGEEVFLRPVKPIDERMVQEFFYAMGDREVYYRFLHAMKVFPRKDMQRMVNVDYNREMSVVALVGEFGNQEIAGLGRYVVGEGGFPEVDFAVREAWQGKGLGKAIMSYLAQIAGDRGFKGISAVVMSENQASAHILYHLGYAVTGTVNGGVIELKVNFDQPVSEPKVDLRYENDARERYRQSNGQPKDEPLTRI